MTVNPADIERGCFVDVDFTDGDQAPEAIVLDNDPARSALTLMVWAYGGAAGETEPRLLPAAYPAIRRITVRNTFMRVPVAANILTVLGQLAQTHLQPRVARGLRVRLLTPVERAQGVIAPAGATGTVADVTDDAVCVRVDQPLPGAEAWDNEIVWRQEDLPEPVAEALAGLAPRDLAIAAMWRDCIPA